MKSLAAHHRRCAVAPHPAAGVLGAVSPDDRVTARNDVCVVAPGTEQHVGAEDQAQRQDPSDARRANIRCHLAQVGLRHCATIGHAVAAATGSRCCSLGRAAAAPGGSCQAKQDSQYGRDMKYEDPPLLRHAEADEVLRAALRAVNTSPYENSVLVGLALYDDDRAYVEDWCVRLAEQAEDLWLRGLACLCIGSHLARRFHVVGDRAAALVRAMADDPAMVAVNGQVLDARDDLDLFVSSS